MAEENVDLSKVSKKDLKEINGQLQAINFLGKFVQANFDKGLKISDGKHHEKIADKIDSNSDGKINLKEADAAAKKASPEEFKTALKLFGVSGRYNMAKAVGANPSMSKDFFTKLFKAFDEGFNEGAGMKHGVLESFDLNKNGSVSPTELKEAINSIDKASKALQEEISRR